MVNESEQLSCVWLAVVATVNVGSFEAVEIAVFPCATVPIAAEAGASVTVAVSAAVVGQVSADEVIVASAVRLTLNKLEFVTEKLGWNAVPGNHPLAEIVTTVTVAAVPTVPDPVPEPLEPRYAAAMPLAPITRPAASAPAMN